METSNSEDKGNTPEKGFTTTWISNRRVFHKKIITISVKKVIQQNNRYQVLDIYKCNNSENINNDNTIISRVCQDI